MSHATEQTAPAPEPCASDHECTTGVCDTLIHFCETSTVEGTWRMERDLDALFTRHVYASGRYIAADYTAGRCEDGDPCLDDVDCTEGLRAL